jgi:hypothetical protein
MHLSTIVSASSPTAMSAFTVVVKSAAARPSF